MTRHRHSRRHKRSQRGGNYTSASTYGSYVNGSGDSQYNRVFDQTNTNQSNIIIGAQGQNSQQAGIPSAQNLSLVQSAGSRRRKRGKKGGFWGQIVNQALVPFSILGMQQTYRRKRQGGKKTRRYRR